MRDNINYYTNVNSNNKYEKKNNINKNFERGLYHNYNFGRIKSKNNSNQLSYKSIFLNKNKINNIINPYYNNNYYNNSNLIDNSSFVKFDTEIKNKFDKKILKIISN